MGATYSYTPHQHNYQVQRAGMGRQPMTAKVESDPKSRQSRGTSRVLTTPAREPDFSAVKDEDRAAVVENLFAWVEGARRAPPSPGRWRSALR